MTAHGKAEYCEQVADVFLGLPGAPLLISPGEYLVVEEWRRQGVPLHLVLEIVQEVLGGERRQRRVTLRYCKPAVEEAWENYREMVAQGGV